MNDLTRKIDKQFIRLALAIVGIHLVALISKFFLDEWFSYNMVVFVPDKKTNYISLLWQIQATISVLGISILALILSISSKSYLGYSLKELYFDNADRFNSSWKLQFTILLTIMNIINVLNDNFIGALLFFLVGSSYAFLLLLRCLFLLNKSEIALNKSAYEIYKRLYNNGAVDKELLLERYVIFVRELISTSGEYNVRTAFKYYLKLMLFEKDKKLSSQKKEGVSILFSNLGEVVNDLLRVGYYYIVLEEVDEFLIFDHEEQSVRINTLVLEVMRSYSKSFKIAKIDRGSKKNFYQICKLLSLSKGIKDNKKISELLDSIKLEHIKGTHKNKEVQRFVEYNQIIEQNVDVLMKWMDIREESISNNYLILEAIFLDAVKQSNKQAIKRIMYQLMLFRNECIGQKNQFKIYLEHVDLLLLKIICIFFAELVCLESGCSGRSALVLNVIKDDNSSLMKSIRKILPEIIQSAQIIDDVYYKLSDASFSDRLIEALYSGSSRIAWRVTISCFFKVAAEKYLRGGEDSCSSKIIHTIQEDVRKVEFSHYVITYVRYFEKEN